MMGTVNILHLPNENSFSASITVLASVIAQALQVVSVMNGFIKIIIIRALRFFSCFRKQIMYPFLTVGAVGEYDVDCGVIGGGTSGPCIIYYSSSLLWQVMRVCWLC